MGSYTFSYTTSWFPHLTTITSSSYPAENYSFTYTSKADLLDPFTGAYLGINAQMLQTVTNTNSSMTSTFAYGTNSSGELNQVTFAYGGSLSWSYANATYSTGNHTQREIQNRYLVMSSGANTLTYQLTHPGDTG